MENRNYHTVERDKAETFLVKNGCYIPRSPDIPDELEEWVDKNKDFVPPASATDFDDLQLGCAYSYMNSLAEFVESQLGLFQVELSAAKYKTESIENKLLVVMENNNGSVTLKKAQVKSDKEYMFWKKTVNRLTSRVNLMEKFLNVYDRKCKALSRELTRRGITTERWERDYRRGS